MLSLPETIQNELKYKEITLPLLTDFLKDDCFPGKGKRCMVFEEEFLELRDLEQALRMHAMLDI